MRRVRKNRGSMLLEALCALTLAVTLTSVFAVRIASQSVLLRAANEEAQARAALRSGYERLRAGVVPPPRGSDVLTLEAKDGLTLTVTCAPGELDPRLAGAGGITPVLLRVTWVGADRKPRERELVTLVAESSGGAR